MELVRGRLVALRDGSKRHDSLMHEPTDEYARATRLLLQDRERDGAAALFHTALNNGLVALVAGRWPGEECKRSGFVLFAHELLPVIERNGREIEPGGRSSAAAKRSRASPERADSECRSLRETRRGRRLDSNRPFPCKNGRAEWISPREARPVGRVSAQACRRRVRKTRARSRWLGLFGKQ